MPALELTVNVPIPDERAFVLEFSKAAARILFKLEQQVLVNVKYNPNLSFAGSMDPAFLLTIGILDNSTPENNEKFSKELFQFITEKLGIPNIRGYIVFTDPGRAHWGWRSTTVAKLMNPSPTRAPADPEFGVEVLG